MLGNKFKWLNLYWWVVELLTKQLKILLLANFLDGASNWTAKKPQLSSKQIRGDLDASKLHASGFLNPCSAFYIVNT